MEGGNLTSSENRILDAMQNEKKKIEYQFNYRSKLKEPQRKNRKTRQANRPVRLRWEEKHRKVSNPVLDTNHLLLHPLK